MDIPMSDNIYEFGKKGQIKRQKRLEKQKDLI